MKKQFLRLYIVSALVLIGLIVLFGQLYNELFYPESEHAIMLPQAELARLMLEPSLQRISLESLMLPKELTNSLLQSGQLLLSEASSDIEPNYYLYILDPITSDQVIQVGPFTLLPEPKAQNWAFIVFYALLAFILLVVFKPLFNDLNRMQSAVVKFSSEPNNIPVVANKHSSIYPLAKGLSVMSEKITHFLRLHQDLSRILSHEIRIPLSRIRLAMPFLSTEDSATSKGDILLIEQALDDIEMRLEQYLSYARIEDQFSVYQLEQVDLKQIISEKIALASVYTELTITFNCQVVHAFAEANSIAVAVQNMLGNALKYANKEISISLSQADSNVVLCVEDDGPGLPHNAEDLIKPFKRGEDQSLSSGYGLGLYIIQRVAHWHGGQLDVSTGATLGGACICITWPGGKR